jgi:glutathione S-transferase
MSKAKDDLIFYYAPQSRAVVIYWLLEELGIPYTMRTLDLQKGEQRSAEFLAVNPMGKVPTIEHHGVAVSEVAAISTYLADAFPDAGLSVPIGDAQRGPYLKWLFFGPGCVEPAMTDRSLKRASGPEGAVGYGSYERVIEVISSAVAKGDYLVAGRFTAADVVIGASLAYGMLTKAVDPRPRFPLT